MRLIILIIVTFLVVTPGLGQSIPEEIYFDKDIEVGREVSRPDSEGVPTKVSVGIYVIDILKISDAEQTFTADIAVNVQWKDRRLGNNTKVRTLSLINVWHPYIQIKNQHKLSKHLRDIVEVDTNGMVTYRQRFSGEFSFSSNLKDFPFDKHVLSIGIVSFRYGPEDVAFEVYKTYTGRAENLSIVDWSIRDGKSRISPYYFAPEDRNISQIFYEFSASRNIGYYFWAIIFPMMIIVSMSWSVFWISPRQVGAQIGVASTTILTLFAFKMALVRILPKIPYLTRLDFFIMASTIISFLALTEVILTSNLVDKNDKVDLAFKVDRWCRWIFPIVFALITVFVFGW